MLFFKELKKLFVFAFDNVNNDNKESWKIQPQKYFLPRVNITNYNVLIHGRNFYVHPVVDQIKKTWRN